MGCLYVKLHVIAAVDAKEILSIAGNILVEFYQCLMCQSLTVSLVIFTCLCCTVIVTSVSNSYSVLL